MKLGTKMSGTSVINITSVKIEVGCRDDTVPKTVDTRRHCKVGLKACNNLPQPPPYIFGFWGLRKIVACPQLLPRSAFLYLQFLAQCHPYILLRFLYLYYDQSMPYTLVTNDSE